jgi:hypothetical protein
MRLEESSPGSVLTPNRRRIKSVTAADVVDGRIAQSVAEIIQGPDDAVATPTRIFPEHFDDELFEFRIYRRSADGICSGKGPLPSDQNPKPTEQSVGSDHRGDLPKTAPPDDFRFPSQPEALRLGEAPGFAAELFEENPILLLEVFDHRLLVSVHPTSHGNQKELELGCHRARNHSKFNATQL